MSAHVLLFPARSAFVAQTRIEKRLSSSGRCFSVDVITRGGVEPLGTWPYMGDAFRVAQHHSAVRNLPIGLAILRGGT